MADQLATLQLVLDSLALHADIATIDDRVSIQKAVCLTQLAGVPLGYSYNWYVRGPYSPALTTDYYQLASSKARVEKEAEDFTLTEASELALNKVRDAIEKPDGVPLQNPQWLELLASIAFLIKTYQFDQEKVRDRIVSTKADLAPFFDPAYQSLKSAELVE